MNQSKVAASIVVVCIALFISVSLSVTYYFTCTSYASGHEDNAIAFKSFSGGLEQYKKLRQEWRPRLFANYFASLLVPSRADTRYFQHSVGLWNAGWFLACCLMYVAFDFRNAIFLVFGTFGALYYAFTPLSESHIYPWDMPALFFYVLIYVTYARKSITPLLLILWVGAGFKETVALGSMIFLFRQDLSLQRRFAYFLAAAVGCVSVKLAIDLLTGSPSLLLTMTFDNFGLLSEIAETHQGFAYNWQALTKLYLNHPIFVNAGTLVIFLLLLPKDQEDWMWKALGVLFLVGIMFCGVVNEARVFFEMIPLSLWAINKKLQALQARL
jgi:hypothetical protein